jgi:hypothetical protein
MLRVDTLAVTQACSQSRGAGHRVLSTWDPKSLVEARLHVYYVVNDSPQPQLPLLLGLEKTNSDLEARGESVASCE